jgi:hypothetical protein
LTKSIHEPVDTVAFRSAKGDRINGCVNEKVPEPALEAYFASCDHNTPAAMAEPMTPATFGAIACISR